MGQARATAESRVAALEAFLATQPSRSTGTTTAAAEEDGAGDASDRISAADTRLQQLPPQALRHPAVRDGYGYDDGNYEDHDRGNATTERDGTVAAGRWDLSDDAFERYVVQPEDDGDRAVLAQHLSYQQQQHQSPSHPSSWRPAEPSGPRWTGGGGGDEPGGVTVFEYYQRPAGGKQQARRGSASSAGGTAKVHFRRPY